MIMVTLICFEDMEYKESSSDAASPGYCLRDKSLKGLNSIGMLESILTDK